jgi:hypothetical protein
MPIEKFLILLVFLSIPALSIAGVHYNPNDPIVIPNTTYHKYVNGTTGDDSWDGTSATHVSGTVGPRKTINSFYIHNYTNKDYRNLTIHVAPGTYYERVTFTATGYHTWPTQESERHYLVADGGAVIMDMSPAHNLGTWAVHSGSIYKATYSPTPAEGISAVVIDDNFKSYHPVTSIGAIASAGDWFYDSGTAILYVWPAFAGSPSGHDIVTPRKNASNNGENVLTFQNNTNYVTVRGITVRGASDSLIFSDGATAPTTGVHIEQCKVLYGTKGGVYVGGTTNFQLTKNKVYGNVLSNWPRGNYDSGCWNTGGWPPSVAVFSASNGLVTGNDVGYGGGEGIIFLDNTASGGNIAEYNIVSNAWSTLMYFDHGVGSTIRNNFLYVDDYLTAADYRTVGCDAAQQSNIRRRGIAQGITEANEAGDGSVISHDNNVYNNLIVGARLGLMGDQDQITGSGNRGGYWANNTVVLTPFDMNSIGGGYATGIRVGYNSGNNASRVVKNNLVIGQRTDDALASWLGVSDPSDSGITWDNNIYYSTVSNSTPYIYKGVRKTLAQWKSATSQDTNALEVNPLLAGTIGTLTVDDYIPTSSSPTREAGANLSAIFTTDYNNYARVTPAMTVGAFEYGSVSSDPPVLDTTPPTTTASPAAGTYSSAQSVTLTANEPATIYYTNNGDTPVIGGPTTNIYSSPITVSSTKTIKYFAVDTAGNSEIVKSGTWTIQIGPSQSPSIHCSFKAAAH